MPKDTIAHVTALLEEATNVHDCVRSAILCTTEGVVVASITKDQRTEPTVLATISAALVWASQTTIAQVGGQKPTYLIHNTRVERILIVLQPHYQLVLVISKSAESGFELENYIDVFESIATRIELAIGSSEIIKHEDLLSKIVTAIPDIREAMLITYDGLPLSSVGFKNHIEIAGLAGSIFANGLTYSSHTDSVVVKADRLNFLIVRVDDNRLLVTICRGNQADIIASDVERVLKELLG